MNDFQTTTLYKLLGQKLPPIHQIEQELGTIDAGIVADMVASEPEIVFIVDYYFRLLDPKIGARIVSSESFAVGAALELFNCQILRYQRSHLAGEEGYDFAYASMLESYWREVDNTKLTLIFQELLRLGKSNHFAAMLILQQMNLDNLIFMQADANFRSPAMLALFKNLGGNVQKLISENLDLFDFVYRLASDLKDEDYLTFLDEFTGFVMEIRIGRTLADDAAQHLDEHGKVPLNTVVHLLEGIPDESRRITLEIMRQRGHIDPGLMEGLMALQAELGIR
ncbi:MAG: hypothetical protein NXI24_05000 [bacterium]|nr:hypothetical protein [bacterium]